MRTPYLVVVTCPILAVLALTPAVPVLSPVLCLVALFALGSLWVRALVREPLTPAARLGLSVVAGLVSLPLVALALYVLSLRIEARGLAAGLAVLAVVLAACGWRRGPAGVGLSTALAAGVPMVLALLVGGAATVAYQRLPHPAEPGYTSLALAGWAAGIARPVAIPMGGVEVPLEMSSAGERPETVSLQVRVGGRLAGPGVPVAVTGGTRGLRVHVPAPTDGCLHPVRISLGAASTVFYGRGPFPARILTRRGAVPC